MDESKWKVSSGEFEAWEMKWRKESVEVGEKVELHRVENRKEVKADKVEDKEKENRKKEETKWMTRQEQRIKWRA